MTSGSVGTILGVLVFNLLRSVGQLDLIVSVCYVIPSAPSAA